MSKKQQIGEYYKDVDNDYNKFIGTWEYTNGNTSFRIEFKKREKVYIEQGNSYYDFLIGDYLYVENGIEKINTLSLMNGNYQNPYDYNIVGRSIIKPTSAPVCFDCQPNERRVILSFSDPTRPGLRQGLSGDIVVRRRDASNTQKIEVKLRQKGSVIPEKGQTLPNSFNVPWGTYTLTKVN